MRARLAESDPMHALNEVTLDGRGLSVRELQACADALPFLGERRLVIVAGLVGSAAGRKDVADALIDYLPRVPPTTRLVLVEGELAANHRVLRWAERWRPAAEAPDQTVLVKRFEAPRAAQLPGWLARRAEARGRRRRRWRRR
jgi:hypothetical protein